MGPGEKWKEEQGGNFQTRADVKKRRNLNIGELPFGREPFREYLCKVEMWTNCTFVLFPQKGPWKPDLHAERLILISQATLKH